MADAGTRAADKAQAAMERKMRRIYRQAQREIIEKLNAQTQRMYALDAQKRADVESGKITPQQYKNWLIGQQFTQRQWKDKVDSVATTLLYANQQANAIVEGEKRAVFGENATYAAYEMEHGMGRDLSFSVYDSATVTKLLREDPELLPRRVVNGQKDKAWNRQKISAAVTQGIIQGESIPQIAKRIAKHTASSNMTAMTRYARTAMTSAQNAGRMEAMHHAQEMGIKVQKKWLATLDNRTRDAHAMLDGQVQDVDKPFQSELGPIMFPGDPSADPGNVYNCRCALQWIYPEYVPKTAGQRRDNISGELIKDMTYAEWKAAKAKTVEKSTGQEQTIAGIVRGQPMTHAEADTGRVNPNFRLGGGYTINCQSCVATYEARLRGYDVEVVPNDREHPACRELAKDTRRIWKKKDGSTAEYMIGDGGYWKYAGVWEGETPTARRLEKKLLEALDENGRYTIQFKWRGFNSGHIVTIQKDADELVIYDPQSNKLLRGKYVSEYLDRMQYQRQIHGMKYYSWPSVMRVDDKDFNFDMANKVMRKAGGDE